MKVFLRKFLEIVGNDFVETYVARLYIEEQGELFEEWISKRKIEIIKDAKELEPYLDFEITSLRQEVDYGEIVEQRFYVRKSEELTQSWKTLNSNNQMSIMRKEC